MLSFNKIVNIMLKKGGKVLFKDDIFEIIDPEKKPEFKSKLDKTIYNLKAKGYIISLKSGVYIIPDDEDKTINKVDLIDKYYLKLLKKYITQNVGSNYYISGKKALEFHHKNYGVPEKVVIINRDLNKKIFVGDYEVIFKTVSGKDEASKNKKKINLFSKFYNFVNIKVVEGIEFKVSNLELSLIESSILNDSEQGIPIDLITKTLKKYKGSFEVNTFYEIGKYKYIMSFNRLKELSKSIDDQLYMVFLEVIKQNGGLFIGEGLRGF